MQIVKTEIPIRDLVKGYSDDPQTGRIVGYNGILDIRPVYQREFVYGDKQRDAVINTVRKGFPLNTIYWAVTPNGFEVLDGQQRIISICQYVTGGFSLNYQFFHNLTKDEQDAILDYKLDVYQCTGTDREKLEWFETINIAGAVLTKQELRNAVYAGPFTGAAKKKFVPKNCAAELLAKQYLAGNQNRQDWLETALSWIAYERCESIEDYMARHQQDVNCNELWGHFSMVIEWVKAVFPNYRKEMKGLPWGEYFTEYAHGQNGRLIYPTIPDDAVAELMTDDDVTKKKGIYEYLLSDRKELKALSIRNFSEAQRREAYERQRGVCPHCVSEGGINATKVWAIEEMDADHIIPWSKGGKTVADNCQMLCKYHNGKKSGN